MNSAVFAQARGGDKFAIAHAALERALARVLPHVSAQVHASESVPYSIKLLLSMFNLYPANLVLSSQR